MAAANGSTLVLPAEIVRRIINRERFARQINMSVELLISSEGMRPSDYRISALCADFIQEIDATYPCGLGFDAYDEDGGEYWTSLFWLLVSNHQREH